MVCKSQKEGQENQKEVKELGVDHVSFRKPREEPKGRLGGPERRKGAWVDHPCSFESPLVLLLHSRCSLGSQKKLPHAI
jgi:hypothetical protein